MGGWPPEGRWAAEGPGSQGTRGGRSLETGSVFPWVVHDLVRGLRVVSWGEGGCGLVLEARREPAECQPGGAPISWPQEGKNLYFPPFGALGLDELTSYSSVFCLYTCKVGRFLWEHRHTHRVSYLRDTCKRKISVILFCVLKHARVESRDEVLSPFPVLLSCTVTFQSTSLLPLLRVLRWWS